MDIFKLRNDYLKKINKTASELNRRLEFLNKINNTISHNNMIGGAANSEPINVKKVISENTTTVNEIKVSLQKMKQEQQDAKKMIDALNIQSENLKKSVSVYDGSVAKLEEENKRLNASIRELTEFLNTNMSDIRDLSK